MNTKWTKAVDRINQEKFRVPEGWETRDQVALSLECSPDKVAAILKPGLDEGAFESCQFSVWNQERRMTERVTCYRMVDKSAPPVPKPSGNTLSDRIAACILRHPDWPNHKVAKNFRGVSSGNVAKVRADLKA